LGLRSAIGTVKAAVTVIPGPSAHRPSGVRPPGREPGIHNLDSCQRYSARILPNL